MTLKLISFFVFVILFTLVNSFPEIKQYSHSDGLKEIYANWMKNYCSNIGKDLKLVRLSNSRVYCFSEATDKKTWKQAESFCNSKNMHLAKFDDESDIRLVSAYAEDAYGNQPVWINAHEVNNKGRAVWAKTGKYDDDGEAESLLRCGATDGTSAGKIMMHNCSENFVYICEMTEECSLFVDAHDFPKAED